MSKKVSKDSDTSAPANQTGSGSLSHATTADTRLGRLSVEGKDASGDQREEVREALAQLRKQLLDLTAHNPLISFKHSKNGRYLRLVGESPNQIARQLFDGKVVPFSPVPDPSKQEIESWKAIHGEVVKKRPPVERWAAECGIATTHDLPDESIPGETKRAAKLRLQTLNYPDALESKASTLYRLSRTMVEETGTNVLHLVFGYLEWFESSSSEKSHFAPLYTIPVALERGSIDRITSTYQFTLRVREDEVQFNASLAVRLVDDFGFVLPEIAVDQLPEDYLNLVERAISKPFPRWKVHRWGTMAMLNFSRLMMFRDLEPENWPSDHQLDLHPLVNAVIRRDPTTVENDHANRGESFAAQVEYDIDGIENLYEEFPLVDVADSSQHSALIDAIKGRNLVIQGPPGTGKSQTITNLIAAAMKQGKSVLFVSEKLAALQVVKHRMERLGLGDFCLELHSHNTKKVGIMESLKRRLEASYPDTQQLEDLVARHRKLSDLLNGHAERINQNWKNTGRGTLEILMRCTRYREELRKGWRDCRIEGLNGDTWGPLEHAEALTEFMAFAETLEAITRELPKGKFLDEHPWRGVESVNLDSGDTKRIMSLLADWGSSMDRLLETLGQFPGAENVLSPTASAEEVASVSQGIAKMPSEAGDIDWDHLEGIRETGLESLDSNILALRHLQSRCDRLANLKLQEIVESEALLDLEVLTADLVKSGINQVIRLSELEAMEHTVEQLLQLIEEWAALFADYKEHIGDGVPPMLDASMLSLHGMHLIRQAIEMNATLRPGDLAFRSERCVPSKFEADASEFRNRITELRKERSEMETTFDLSMLRDSIDLPAVTLILDETSRIKRVFGSAYRGARREIQAAMLRPKEDWVPDTISATLKSIQAFFEREREFLFDERWIRTLGAAFNGIDTDLDRFERIVSWHTTLETIFCKDDLSIFKDKELDKNGRWILKADEQCLRNLDCFTRVDLNAAIKKFRNLLSELAASYGYQEIPVKARLTEPVDSWRQIIDYLKKALPSLSSLLPALGKTLPSDLGMLRYRLNAYSEIRQAWNERMVELSELNEQYFSGRLPTRAFDADALSDAVGQTRLWCDWLNHPEVPEPLKAEVTNGGSAASVAQLRGWQTVAKPWIQEENEGRQSFESCVSLNTQKWSDSNKLRIVRSRIKEACGAKALLPCYLSLNQLRASLANQGFDEVCKKAASIGLNRDEAHALFEYLVSASLVAEILKEDSAIRRFNGVLQSSKLGDFKQCDRSLLRQMQIRTAKEISKRRAPDGVLGTRVSQHTERALIEHEIEKQKRHIPLRQLIMRAGKAVQALKPCFMMGPRSVAQYLPPGAVQFDLVVIDEASQMRPADALGAIARCRQLVVVGDSKQLAPSTFFERISNPDEDDEEQFETTVSESILDAVAPVFHRRQLLWHYRSRHPSLIAFSNREFYDTRLKLFPSPHYDGEALGIILRYIPDGLFVDQVNTAEAMAVAERVRELLLADSEISLGVATMNAKQRDLIERLLEDHAKHDEQFAQAWESNGLSEEPLFIKNLENVQGDEREVMIISCTYGRSLAGGRVMQRFGPINSQDGDRRLNVLFTRSRTRMEIFSSMQSGEVLVAENSSPGVRAFRGMLRYAETGIIEGATNSGREPESDFEIAVARLLRKRGYEVDCQIGVAGFFIDLAVKHPHQPGQYSMGIECDGAAYHSSKSARDRDRLRQEVLESMGWNIKRIWSTDWFYDPERAIGPILDELATLQK
jgi:very-short-patch-repair endonuclease